MKSRILTLAVLFLAVAVSNIQAQSTSDVTVNANVLTTFSFDAFAGDDGEVDFGDVVPGVTPFLDPTGDSNTDVGSGFSLAQLAITGPNIEITIGHDTDLTLTSDIAATDLQYIPSLIGAQNDTDQSSASDIVPGGTIVTLAENDYYLWVGGTLQDVGGGAIPATAGGSYSGDFTITVDIN